MRKININTFSTYTGVTRGVLQGGPGVFPLLGSRCAFTLVELIVVVTILALLSTIGFVSYSSYLSGVRDTNRLSQLVAISDGLELYRTKKTLPIPDDNIEIRANGTVIGYQGYAGINVLETIDYSKTGKDPKDKTYFSYYLTQDKKHYQLLTYLEEEENLETNNNLFQKTYADIDYTNRYPKVSGKKIGILTQSGTNIPVQEVTEIVSSGYLDIATTTDSYVARLTDDNNISGTGAELKATLPAANCKRLKQMGKSAGDGEYKINPTGTQEFKVYCDMTTDGGGWTLINNDLLGTQDTKDVSILKTITRKGGVNFEVSLVNPNSCTSDHGITVLVGNDISWTHIKADYKFYGGSSCWGGFGDKYSLINLDDNLIIFDANNDKMSNEIKMTSSTVDSFDGVTKRCDNETTTNFWHSNKGLLERSTTIILRKENNNLPAGPHTDVKCVNGSTVKWKYENIYIR